MAESGKFVFDIVLEKVTKTLAVAVVQESKLGLEVVGVKDVVDADTGAGRLGAVGRTNTASSSADLAGAELFTLALLSRICMLKS